MKQFEVGKWYKDWFDHDCYSFVWKMQVLSRTKKTITAEIIKPSGKHEIKTLRIRNAAQQFNKEIVAYMHVIFSPDLEV